MQQTDMLKGSNSGNDLCVLYAPLTHICRPLLHHTVAALSLLTVMAFSILRPKNKVRIWGDSG